jgi:hypothetical protein
MAYPDTPIIPRVSAQRKAASERPLEAMKPTLVINRVGIPACTGLAGKP